MKPPRPPRGPSDRGSAAPQGARPKASPRPEPEETSARPPRGVSVPAPVEASAVFGSSVRSGQEINERRDERRRARSQLVKSYALRALAGVLAVAAAVWVLWFSPLFALRDGSVSVVAQSGDVDLAPVTAIVNQRIGEPLPRINTGALEADILADPAIATARVNRDWPGGLTVVVSPRTAVFGLQTDHGYSLVGADGVVIRDVDVLPDGVFPVQVSGDKLTPSAAQQIVALWGTLGDAVRGQVSLVKLSGTQFSLELGGGGTVVWGKATDSELKGQVLSLLMEQRPSSVYDVSDPTRPSVR